MNRLQANLCLLCVTFCWSTEVIIFACIPDSVSPFATTSITYLVGGGLLVLAFFKRIKSELRADFKRLFFRCLMLSAITMAYNTMYQFGLKDFDVSNGAFTLSLTVVALPIIIILQRQKVDKKTWFSAVLVLAGICISLYSVMTRSQIPGLTLIAAGCVMRAFFILKLNQYAREHDPVTLSALICLFGGIISFFFWMGASPATFAAIPWSPVIIASLAIYSYFVVALTTTLNIFAQRRTTATNATIIYSLEIVFSVIWGAVLPASLITKVRPTPYIIAGVVCVVIGNLIEILEAKKPHGSNKESPHGSGKENIA